MSASSQQAPQRTATDSVEPSDVGDVTLWRGAAFDALESLDQEGLLAHLRLLQRALPSAAYVLDLQTREVAYLNHHVGRDLGYSAEEIAAFGGFPLALIHPDDAERLPSLFSRWREQPEADVLETELRLRARDGSWRWFRTREAPLERDAEGQVFRVVGTTQDITDRRSTERQSLTGLRLDAMGHVAGHLAHEYNNLLTALSGQLGLAEDSVWDPEQLRAVLSEARQTVEKTASLTRRLLGFANQQVARRELVLLEDLLKEAAPLLRSLFQLNQIRFDFHEAPPCFANRTQLLELLVQLVNSASTGASSVVVHCGPAAPPKSHLASTGHVETGGAPDPWAMLRVEEHLRPEAPIANGEGLQGLAAAATPHLGYGIEVARQLVASFGAHLEVAELDLRCCKLEIRFPPARRGAVTPAGGTPTPRHSGDQPARLLVVEDDAILLELTRRILARAGYDLVLADSGEKALAIWGESGSAIDLVVTDVVMPGMSGLDLASRLLRERADLPVLFVSGFIKDDLKRDASLFQRKGIAFCDKPFRPEELVATVARLLAASQRL